MSDTQEKLGAHEVAAWLRRHPTFLKQFPDLALSLVVPREQGSAASLAGYQLEILRDKNRELSRRLQDLFALHKPSRWTTLRKLYFPAAMPAIFAGLRISAGLAVVGAIVGDFFFKQGEPGIGVLIDNFRSRLQAPELFASIVLASLLGIVFFWFFGWLSNRVVGRWYQK